MDSRCRTEKYFRLEALLACIRGRLGFKYISLPVWRQGTDCNNNKGREIYFRRIHQFIMGYVNNEIRNNISTVSTRHCMRLKSTEWTKILGTNLQYSHMPNYCYSSPTPEKNVRRLYPEFFPNFNFCKLGKGCNAWSFSKGSTVFWAH